MKRTQVEIIHDILLTRKGDWVGMPALAMEAGCYAVHSRIADIRDLGETVENMQRTDPITGKRLSYYRIPVPEQQELSLA